MSAQTPEQRRERVMSVSSQAIPTNELEEAAPVREGEEAGQDVLKKLLAKETEDDLEKAGKRSRAKWKMQIWIKSDRSVQKPLTFTLSIWESGKRLHGGGDESTFICRRNPNAPKPTAPPFVSIGRSSTFKKPLSVDGCDTIIPGDNAVHGKIVCPGCGIRWDTEHIADSLFYRLPVENAAVVLVSWFRALDSDCDLYVKFRAEDIRVKMQAEAFGIHEAQRRKGLMIFPLRNIIRQTAGGATLESRFKAMLLA